MTAMIAEAARVVEDGIALRPIDVDAVFLFGYGFPRFRGGPLHYADQVGAAGAGPPHRNPMREEDPHYWQVPDILQPHGRDGAHLRRPEREALMDLSYSPEEQAFRERCATFLAEKLPADLARKVREGRELSKHDMERWHAILNEQGWLATTWPEEYGGPGWTPVQRHIFEEECARADAPRIVPFGLHMLGPVLHKVRHATSRRRNTCRASSTGATGGARAIPSRAPGPTSPASRPARSARATITSSTARRPGRRWASTPTGSSAWCAPRPRASRRRGSASC